MEGDLLFLLSANGGTEGVNIEMTQFRFTFMEITLTGSRRLDWMGRGRSRWNSPVRSLIYSTSKLWWLPGLDWRVAEKLKRDGWIGDLLKVDVFRDRLHGLEVGLKGKEESRVAPRFLSWVTEMEKMGCGNGYVWFLQNPYDEILRPNVIR